MTPPPRAPGVVRSGVLCAGRDLRVLSRSPVALVQSILFPTLLLLTLLAAFGRTIGGSVDAYSSRLVPQLVVAAGAFGAIGTGITVWTDRTTGMVDRLRSLPVARSAFLTGAVAADAVRALAAAAVVVAVGHLFGFRFDEGPLAAVGFFALATAFGTGWAWLAIRTGLTARNAEAVGSTMNAPVLVLFFLSTGFVPVEGYPGYLQPIVRANPLSCAVNALLGLSSGGPVLVPALQALGWAAAVTLLFAWSAIGRYRTAV